MAHFMSVESISPDPALSSHFTSTTTTTTQHHTTTTTMATFQIHYFSTASSYANKNTEALPAPLPLAQLFDTLESRYPGIREKVLQSCGVSVGDEYVDVEEAEQYQSEGRVIQAGDEVAIIPPVSSG